MHTCLCIALEMTSANKHAEGSQVKDNSFFTSMAFPTVSSAIRGKGTLDKQETWLNLI